MSSSALSAFEGDDQTATDQQRNAADDAKAAIDKPPRERNTADGASNQRQRNNARTGDEAEGDHPLVPDRII